MKVLLSKKEKIIFDLLNEDIGVLDSLNILNQFSLLAYDILVSEDSENIEEIEDDEGDEGDEIVHIPKVKRVKPETTIIPEPIKYDHETITESRMYV